MTKWWNLEGPRELSGEFFSSVQMRCKEIYFIDIAINKGVMKKRVMHDLKGRMQYWGRLEHIYKGQRSLEVNSADRDEPRETT